ncbi:MAG: sodium ion-translocating decarboxylase subunit beta [Dysosmobacter sp.]
MRPAAIGIIGGADGPTAIFVTDLLAPALLGPIAVAAYSYMALVPVIQPPIMKLLTTEKERQIVMKPLAGSQQEGEDRIPHRGDHLCGPAGALCRPPHCLPHAGQPL